MAKPSMTIEQLRRAARNALTEAGIESADIDCKILMCEAFGFDTSDLIAKAQTPVSTDELERFNTLLKRRIAHEPIAYITGKQAFWSLELNVSPDVLIPRPETEGVVERALELLNGHKDPVIVDVGTGSGAILLSILHERSDASGIGLDISDEALQVAKSNGEKYGLMDRAKFASSDYLTSYNKRADMVVSNPPYITDQAMNELSQTVGEYEPALALRGGETGLTAYKAIIADLSRVLVPEGLVVFEIGFDQGELVRDLLMQNGFEGVRVDQDLAGYDRVVSGKLSV